MRLTPLPHFMLLQGRITMCSRAFEELQLPETALKLLVVNKVKEKWNAPRGKPGTGEYVARSAY